MVSILNFNLKDSNTLFNFENCSIYSFKLRYAVGEQFISKLYLPDARI